MNYFLAKASEITLIGYSLRSEINDFNFRDSGQAGKTSSIVYCLLLIVY